MYIYIYIYVYIYICIYIYIHTYLWVHIQIACGYSDSISSWPAIMACRIDWDQPLQVSPRDGCFLKWGAPQNHPKSSKIIQNHPKSSKMRLFQSWNPWFWRSSILGNPCQSYSYGRQLVTWDGTWGAIGTGQQNQNTQALSSSNGELLKWYPFIAGWFISSNIEKKWIVWGTPMT